VQCTIADADPQALAHASRLFAVAAEHELLADKQPRATFQRHVCDATMVAALGSDHWARQPHQDTMLGDPHTDLSVRELAVWTGEDERCGNAAEDEGGAGSDVDAEAELIPADRAGSAGDERHPDRRQFLQLPVPQGLAPDWIGRA
jgi:hypothetical protein